MFFQGTAGYSQVMRRMVESGFNEDFQKGVLVEVCVALYSNSLSKLQKRKPWGLKEAGEGEWQRLDNSVGANSKRAIIGKDI